MSASGHVPWWRHAVVYQVYIRSFADADGDGTGDLAGLRSRLPYLRRLGVDAIWINPWYRSPLHDGGYDVADYRDLDPRYGTLAEAEAFIDEAHDAGLRVLADLVPNHTSSEHEWFRAALADGPGSAARRRYVFRPGRGDDGEEPPNDWRSVFGGPAWTRVDDGEWYLHLFDVSQPDLDWDNPEVREEFESILRFWLDRGIDGFRVDVAHGLVKDPELPDIGEEPELLGGVEIEDHPHWDRDGVHDIYRSWRRVLDGYPGDRMMVAEAWVRPDRLPLYVRPDEYHQTFNFDILQAPWDASAFRNVIADSLAADAAVGSTPTWVLSNHDVVRHATRYGLPAGTNWRRWVLEGPHDDLDEELGLHRARAAALLVLALPGSIYLYQGEELGLHEVWDLPAEVLDDPVWKRSGHRMKGRDGCRVPIPWTTSGPSFGFGPGDPWLPQPDRFGSVSVETQEGDEGSTFELYRAALELRRRHFAGDEDLEWLDAGEHVVAFRRGSGTRCVVNFGDDPIPLPGGEVVLSSGPIAGDVLPGATAVWLA